MTVLTSHPPGRVRVDLAEMMRRLTIPACVLAAAAAGVVRLFIAGRAPLWLDETWTGAVVSQPTFRAFAEQVYLDVNAPLYYLFEFFWARAFGLSDAMLRLPSALFGIAAPLLIGLWRIEGISAPTRWLWAAMLALWLPGVWYAGDARCYTLLLLLSAAQGIAFVRMLQAPDLRRAALWCGLAALTILTHYYAALVIGIEGLAYLALHRGRALRTWPAALLFLPAAAWIAVHAPRLAVFSQPEVAWYPLLHPSRLPRVLSFIPGHRQVAWGLAGLVLVALLAAVIRRRPLVPAPDRPDAAPWALVGASAAAAAMLIVLGMLRPSFVDRYLMPSIPGLLLGAALAASWLGRRWSPAPLLALLVFALPVPSYANAQIRHGWRFYNWQTASDDLMRGKPERLVFLWDHPATPHFTPAQLEAAGGFFFRRAGIPVEVRAVRPVMNADANPLVMRQTAPERTAIIWAYDVGVRGTTARRFPPRIADLDPRFTCRNYSGGSVGVVACDRFSSTRAPR